MEIQGYALFAAVIVLLTVVYPTLSWRSRVALATPVEESVSENLRVVNSVDRWTSARSPNRGTILPRVESRRMSDKRRVDPTNLRTLAASRARARARVSQRTARMKAMGMVVGVAVLISLVAWILVAAASMGVVLAIIPTVLTIAGGALYGRVLLSAREANFKDQQTIAKLDSKLEKLSATARVQDRRAQASKKAPRKVVEARRASAASAASIASAESAASAGTVASAPSVASAPETVVAAPQPIQQPAPKPQPRAEAPAPTYTPKPTFSRRTVKPFEPAESPTAAVPYRPTQMGEKFSNAVSASSAEAAPVIASFNFDDVLEARRRA